jgi:hypothetical protein
MDARTFVTRGVSTGLRLGRGTADRVLTVARPPIGRLTERVVSKVRRPEPPTTTTFTPSRKATPATDPVPDPVPDSVPDPLAAPVPIDPGAVPTPAVVAHNIAPQRPTAKPPRAAKPKSAPGAKLPPPRPSTS